MAFFKLTLQVLTLHHAAITFAAPQAAPAAPQVASLSRPVNVTSNDNPPGNRKYYRDGGYLGNIGNRLFTMNFDTVEDGPTLGPNFVFAAGNSFTDLVSPSVTHDPDTDGTLTTLCTNSQYKHTWVYNTINIDGTRGLAYATDIGPPGETGIGMFPAVIDLAKTTCTRFPVLFPGGKGPQYGNAGSIVAAGGFLHLYGTGTGSFSSSNVYIARVDPKKYNDLSAYSYWDGTTFNRDPAKTVPIITGAPGGSISYSYYFKAFVFLSTQPFFSGIGARIATNPWGPFSAQTTIFTDSGAGGTYQPNALPTFDFGGKTLAVRYSANHGFYQKSIIVT